jgi:hypothetical protein
MNQATLASVTTPPSQGNKREEIGHAYVFTQI